MDNTCINRQCGEAVPGGRLFCVSCWAAARWGCGVGASVASVLGIMGGILYGVWLSMP